jgi:hypothetical protein
MSIIFNSIIIVHKPYFETQYLSDVLLVLRVVLVCKKKKACKTRLYEAISTKVLTRVLCNLSRVYVQHW